MNNSNSDIIIGSVNTSCPNENIWLVMLFMCTLVSFIIGLNTNYFLETRTRSSRIEQTQTPTHPTQIENIEFSVEL
jgi:hypothetical protein